MSDKFPDILACLVSDELREETGGKIAILGFLGILPSAQIRLSKFGSPLPKLVFTFITDIFPEIAEYKVGITITDSNDNNFIFDFPDPFQVKDLKKSGRLSFALSNITFLTPGDHQISLKVDGIVCYSEK